MRRVLSPQSGNFIGTGESPSLTRGDKPSRYERVHPGSTFEIRLGETAVIGLDSRGGETQWDKIGGEHAVGLVTNVDIGPYPLRISFLETNAPPSPGMPSGMRVHVISLKPERPSRLIPDSVRRMWLETVRSNQKRWINPSEVSISFDVTDQPSVYIEGKNDSGTVGLICERGRSGAITYSFHEYPPRRN